MPTSHWHLSLLSGFITSQEKSLERIVLELLELILLILKVLEMFFDHDKVMDT